MDSPLYLSRIHLENVRCFAEAPIELRGKSAPGTWTILFGDNGCGKTTLLRAIALGLCDETTASGLYRELTGEWIREGALDARIVLSFEDAAGTNAGSTTTIFRKDKSGYDQLSRSNNGENFPWKSVLACGYGAGRLGNLTAAVSEYRTDLALLTLFDYTAMILDPEVPLQRLKSVQREGAAIGWLEKVLQLDPGSIRVDRRGIEVSGWWGKGTPAGAIGEGYRAMMGLIMDVIGWWSLWNVSALPDDVEGIVLIDELEQHLHPSWQRRIVRLMQEQFPKVQFICTSHSALVPIGAADCPSGTCKVVSIRKVENGCEVLEPQEPPVELRADQVLTSYLFGLASTRSDAVAESIEQYSRLRSKEALTDSEAKEI